MSSVRTSITTSSYPIFTTAHDEVRHVPSECASYAKTEPERLIRAQTFLKEELLDPLEGHTLPIVLPSEAPITLLFDCSGSMRGRGIHFLVGSLIRIGDALSAIGRPFEILGFTTRSWKGGEPFNEWHAMENRPRDPGRLNALLHLVFKGIYDDWSKVRMHLAYAFFTDLLKDNIDGEALLWAAERQAEAAKSLGAGHGGIVLISDGAPHDEKTMQVNGSRLLEEHLLEALSEVQQRIPVQVVELFRDYRSPLHAGSITVSNQDLGGNDASNAVVLSAMENALSSAIISLGNTDT